MKAECGTESTDKRSWGCFDKGDRKIGGGSNLKCDVTLANIFSQFRKYRIDNGLFCLPSMQNSFLTNHPFVCPASHCGI